MSKIQTMFNGTGRQLRDAERQSMDAFVKRYQATLTTPPGMVRTAPAPAPITKAAPRRLSNVVVEVASEQSDGKVKFSRTLRARKAAKAAKLQRNKRTALKITFR